MAVFFYLQLSRLALIFFRCHKFCLIIRNNCKISTLFFLGFELDLVHVFAVYWKTYVNVFAGHRKMYVNEKSSY